MAMNFKDTVRFYLALESKKEDDDVCPKCGKNPCECDDDKKGKKGKKDEDEFGDEDDFGDDEEDDEKKASASTNTVDDDDGDAKHASAMTGAAGGDDGDRKHAVACGDDEVSRKKGRMAGDRTPEEADMLDQAEINNKKENDYRLKGANLTRDILNRAKKNASMKDDHTSGRNGSVKTKKSALAEEFLNDFGNLF